MQNTGKLYTKFDEVIRAAGGSDVWGSILVGHNNEIIFVKGYGKCNYASKDCDPLTLYELASLSKNFTAAAILHLQQNKKLKISDGVTSFFENISQDKNSITLHHLLTHTAGLSKEIGVPYTSRIERKSYVRKMLQEPLVAAHGTQHGYSNVGYALLAAVVEQVTDGTFQKYLKQNIFTSAGMNDTGFIGDRELIKSNHVSKRLTDDSKEWTAADWHYYGWGYKGMGGVVSTVLDLWCWSQVLRGDTILNEEMKKILFTPLLEDEACGWSIKSTSRKTRRAEHSGGVAGYGTHMAHFLDENSVIVVLSNDEMKAQKISQRLEDVLFNYANY